MTGRTSPETETREALLADIVKWHRVAMEAGAVTCVGGGHIYPLKDRVKELEAEVERLRGLAQSQQDLRGLLLEALLQIDYLHKKFQPTGTGEATLARIRAALSDTSTDRPVCSRCRGKGYMVKDDPIYGPYTIDCPTCTAPVGWGGHLPGKIEP